MTKEQKTALKRAKKKANKAKQKVQDLLKAADARYRKTSTSTKITVIGGCLAVIAGSIYWMLNGGKDS